MTANTLSVLAYDLTPSEGINDEQTAMVNAKGKDITTQDFIKTAEPFGIAAKKTMEIVEQTEDALARYPQYAKEFGVRTTSNGIKLHDY